MSDPDSNESVVVPSVITRWFIAFRDDVLSGRVSLEELLEVTDVDMQLQTTDLCPDCSRHPVRDRYRIARARGVCGVCYLSRLRDAHIERLAELEVERESVMLKKKVQRLRGWGDCVSGVSHVRRLSRMTR